MRVHQRLNSHLIYGKRQEASSEMRLFIKFVLLYMKRQEQLIVGDITCQYKELYKLH